MKEKKIIQIVHYKGDDTLLEYRLKTFREIDTFVVVHDSQTIIDQPKFGNFINEEKILFLSFDYDKSIDEYQKNIFSKITEFLKSYCKNFEDVILYSEEDEFVDTTKLSEIKEELIYGSFFLFHKCFWWGKNYHQDDLSSGTFVFLFSHLLSQKRMFTNIFLNKNNITNFSKHDEPFGWSLRKFFDSKENDYANNLLPECKLVTKLKKSDLSVYSPPNFSEFPIYNPESHNILISIGKTNFDKSKFTKIVTVVFKNEGRDKISYNKDFSIFDFEILLPKKVLYQQNNFEEFIVKFKENEIKRVIEHVRVTDNDLIEIINPS
jgi:hypothetical protein